MRGWFSGRISRFQRDDPGSIPGRRIPKTKMEQEMSSLKTDFDSFKKSPEKFSVVEKKTFKESLDDYKLDVIKAMRR